MHKKKQENIFINPTFSLYLLLFFVRMAPFSSQHGYIFSFFDGFIRLHVPTVQSMYCLVFPIFNS